MRIRMYRDESGTTAIEFAIVGPVFIFLIVGQRFFRSIYQFAAVS